MNNLKFKPISLQERKIVSLLIKQLYKQDIGNSQNIMTDAKIRRTFKRAVLDPEHLKIEVFKVNEKIIGYAIVFIFGVMSMED